MFKNVKCGYQLPLTIESANKTKDRVIALHKITEQTTSSDLGEKVPKTRLTHDIFFASVQGNP